MLKTTYTSCLERLTRKVKLMEEYIQTHASVIREKDKQDFEVLKEQVRQHEIQSRRLGRWKFKWASKDSQRAANDLEEALKALDAGVQSHVITSYRAMQQEIVETRELNVRLAQLQYTRVTLKTSDGITHEIDVHLKEVNKGGFGTIHKGSCPSLGGTVALKRPSEANENVKRRFESEAKLWSGLKHENILPYHGVCYIDDIPHIVSPYVEDPDLITYVRSHPDLVSKVRITLQIAKGLAYLHTRDPPMIHADIKAKNMLVTSQGHIYICDFGLTKYEDVSTTASSIQSTGTMEWLSPERLTFGQTDDVECTASRTKEDDVYAFGITIAEIVLEDYPYINYGGTRSDIWNGVANRTLRPRGGSGPLWELAQLCWLKDPSLRPTMPDVTEKLLALLDTV